MSERVEIDEHPWPNQSGIFILNCKVTSEIFLIATLRFTQVNSYYSSSIVAVLLCISAFWTLSTTLV